MGGKSSTSAFGGEFVQPDPEWEADSQAENVTQSPDDLVFDTWVTCRAKPELTLPTGKEEEDRQKSVEWRAKKDWIELNCGDDSFFVSSDKTVMGIADGVGGWRKRGVDPSLFANAFMGNSKLYADTHKKEKDIQTILQEGYGKVIRDDIIKMGSSTVCAASLFKATDGQHFLDLINLGDSGAFVMKKHEGVVFRTEDVCHRFNYPYQLSVMPEMRFKYKDLDTLASATHGLVKVNRGDLVVMGTDGLFDNRAEGDLARSFKRLTITNPKQPTKFLGFTLWGGSPELPNPMYSFEESRRMIHEELNQAYLSSTSKHEDTPWSLAYAKESGQHCMGGKPDDITLVVARVMTREEADARKTKEKSAVRAT